MTLRSMVRNSLTTAGLSARAVRGVAQYLSRGEADHETWRAVLDLHCRTNGRSTDMLTSAMRRLRPPVAPIPNFNSMLGSFDATSVESIASKIREDGYYVFEQRFPESVCDSIREASLDVEARVDRRAGVPPKMAKFDPQNPIGFVYDLPEARAWEIPGCQKLIADPIFANVAQAYFEAIPALKNVNVWWSAFMGGQPDTDAAQLFHFDFDPAPIWLKFFVYLTDVTSETGPHVFVRGSHRLQQPKMREILSRGYVRISDEEIASVFGADNVVELPGLKGTVLAVDTMGFHKGKPPKAGSRLLAQLEYATPLFVQSASAPLPMPRDVDPSLLTARKDYPWAFARYPLPF